MSMSRPVNWSNAYEGSCWCIVSSAHLMRQGRRKERIHLSWVTDRDSRTRALDVPVRLNWPISRSSGLVRRKVEYLNALGRAALSRGARKPEQKRTFAPMPRDESLKSLKSCRIG